MSISYDGLPEAYWREQSDRIERLRVKISDRPAIAAGRVIPDDDDLVIGTGRRLNATVMFIDIAQFSSRQSISEAEQDLMLRTLNLFMTEMIRVVEEYGGAVEKNTGDGLMAYFEDYGAENPGANSVKRAVACVMTMLAANQHMIAPILRASAMLPFEFRTSMDYGPVTVALIGAPKRFNANVAIGNAANFASKMLRHVKAGDVGLGFRAWAKLPDAWRGQWTQLAPVATGWTFAGSDRPYPLYLYTGRWSRLI